MAKIDNVLKNRFLESEKRRTMFEDKEFPLKTVYQFSKRVSLYKDGVKMKKLWNDSLCLVCMGKRATAENLQ